MTMLSQDYDFIFKILIVGHTSVGKSNLLLRFSDNVFHESFLPTIGVDFKIRTVEHGSSIVKLQMWDTAGQEKFKTITAAYYKGAHGIVLVYDVTDRSSFNDIQNWLMEVDKYAPQKTSKILVGNKIDLARDRQVSTQEGRAFAASMGMDFIQASAKDNINVEKTFMTITQSMKVLIPTRPGKNNSEVKPVPDKRWNLQKDKPKFMGGMFDCLKFLF